MVAAMRFGEGDLVVAARRADHRGAPGPGPLRGDESGAARRGMPEDGLTLGDRPSLEQQVVSGQPLEHDGRRRLVVDAVWNWHHAFGGRQALSGIGADLALIGHAITDL